MHKANSVLGRLAMALAILLLLAVPAVFVGVLPWPTEAQAAPPPPPGPVDNNVASGFALVSSASTDFVDEDFECTAAHPASDHALGIAVIGTDAVVSLVWKFGGTSHSHALNSGVALVAGAFYSFTLPTASGGGTYSYNLQVSAETTIDYVLKRVQDGGL